MNRKSPILVAPISFVFVVAKSLVYLVHLVPNDMMKNPIWEMTLKEPKTLFKWQGSVSIIGGLSFNAYSSSMCFSSTMKICAAAILLSVYSIFSKWHGNFVLSLLFIFLHNVPIRSIKKSLIFNKLTDIFQGMSHMYKTKPILHYKALCICQIVQKGISTQVPETFIDISKVKS